MLSGDEETWSWRCSRCSDDCTGDDLRVLRNCDEAANENAAWDWDPELRRCPWSQAPRDDEAWEAVAIWVDWRDLGALPRAGTLPDQPYWIYQVIRLGARVAGEAAQRERARAEREQQAALRRQADQQAGGRR